jgi:2-furoyl-CoA dehydrogenase FAD binding subunit
MKPAPFVYYRAERAADALHLLAEHGDEARILAGGQSLVPILNMRLTRPAVLIDISRCAELRQVRDGVEQMVIGAAVTQSELEHHARTPQRLPLLAQALPHLAHVQIRNRGTVCGSLAHADPSAELPLCLVALGGEVVLASAARRRRVAAADFFTGMLSTSRRVDEMVLEACFPWAVPSAGYAFAEIAPRAGDYAVVAVAACARADGLRLAAGGVADRPRAIDWPALHGAALDDALNEFAWSLDASDDAQASAKQRRHLVRRLGVEVIASARRAAGLGAA